MLCKAGPRSCAFAAPAGQMAAAVWAKLRTFAGGPAAGPHLFYRCFYMQSMNKFRLILLVLLPVWAGAVFPAARAAALSDSLPRREMRAVWLTTLGGLDWPRTQVHTPADTLRQQQELTALLDRFSQAGFNTVIMQARVRGTTVYPSRLEPWDGALTGTPGRAPGYDPLAFALRECRRRGMELHAWVVAFPLGRQAAQRQLGRRSVMRQQPGLCRRAGADVYLDPGEPATAPYVAALCAEIARQYDVDGIHLDYIRYPEAAVGFNDRATYRRYGRRQDRAAWRRANVDRVVRAVADSVRAVRPWVRLSCSPVGKYADLPGHSTGGWNARDAVSQDAVRWVSEGWMDFVVPMMYYSGRHYYPFAADWVRRLGGNHVVVGLGAYQLAPDQQNWPIDTLRAQVAYSRLIGAGGQAYFRARFVERDVKGLYALLRDTFYAAPALTPCPYPDSAAGPARPNLRVERDSATLRLSWSALPVPPGGLTYQVYARQPDDSGAPRWQLLQTALRDTAVTLPTPTARQRAAAYAVSATDRWGRTGPLAVAWPPRPRPQAAERRNCRVVLPPRRGARLLVVRNAQGRDVLYRTYRPVVDVSELPAGHYRLLYARRGLRRLRPLRDITLY